jgi:hypothetical protein
MLIQFHQWYLIFTHTVYDLEVTVTENMKEQCNDHMCINGTFINEADDDPGFL